MTLFDTIAECGRITKSKGFNTSHHATQIALIATEVAEALECVTGSGDKEVDAYASNIVFLSADFESHRNRAKDHADASTIDDVGHLYEELADIVIRVFSYAGGNDKAATLMDSIKRKMEKNRDRPPLHGKGF
jgi:NTP pyrophosphatase (non-canonical NTP hydrolase)